MTSSRHGKNLFLDLKATWHQLGKHTVLIPLLVSSNKLSLVRSAIRPEDIKRDISVIQVNVWMKRVAGLRSSRGSVVVVAGSTHNLGVVRSVVPAEGQVHENERLGVGDAERVAAVFLEVGGDGGRHDLIVQRESVSRDGLDALHLRLENGGELLQERGIILSGEGPHGLAPAGSGSGTKFESEVEERILAKGVLDDTIGNFGEALQDCWVRGGLAVDKVGLDDPTIKGSGPDVRYDDGRIWILAVILVVLGNGIEHAWQLAVGSEKEAVASPEVATWVCIKLKIGDDTKVVATTAESLENIWIGLLGDLADGSISEDDGV